MGLSRTVYEINGEFSRKVANFSNPVYFAPKLTASHRKWVSALGVKN